MFISGNTIEQIALGFKKMNNQYKVTILEEQLGFVTLISIDTVNGKYVAFITKDSTYKVKGDNVHILEFLVTKVENVENYTNLVKCNLSIRNFFLEQFKSDSVVLVEVFNKMKYTINYMDEVSEFIIKLPISELYLDGLKKE